MKKLTLLDVPYNGKNRTDYLNLLVEKILALPLSKETKKILSLNLPYYEQGYSKQSLLFLILDKGIIYRRDDEKPTDWSNNFTISEYSNEMKIFKKINITADMVKKTFSEVNNFLKGSHFKIKKGTYEVFAPEKFWLISYESKKHNKNTKSEREKLLETANK